MIKETTKRGGTSQPIKEGFPILPFMLDATESGYVVQPVNAILFLVAAGKIMAAIADNCGR